MSDEVTFTKMKFADILGKPLSKSIYRQLPELNMDVLSSLATMQDGVFTWTVTLHGTINWCPPGCEAETNCQCPNICQRRPDCRGKRHHQHVLIGTDGALYQGYLYPRSRDYEDTLFPDDLWLSYEPLQEERNRLQTERASQPASWTLPAEERNRIIADRARCHARLATVTKELLAIDLKARRVYDQWVRTSLDALPVILLRG